MQPFSIARLPRILFGAGQISAVPAQVAAFGKRVLIVTGARSLRATAHWDMLQQRLRECHITWETFTVSGEPSPELVDQAVAQFQPQRIEVVLGIGGGSVLDAAKAIAGLLPTGHSVMDYLEGVGKDRPYSGPATPFIAVPTTAGTGSEATKNAVLSRQGVNGFKKSFRHEALVAQVAIVDPELLASCSHELLAADGMDAFTQLLESYVSSHANPLTDALAISGMTAFRDGFWAAWANQDETAAATGRAQLAYASLLSGITLAQVGLGSVHGLASPLGAFFPAPHGVVCGTLVAEATALNIAALQERAPTSVALAKYANVGHLLVNAPVMTHVTTPLPQASEKWLLLVETLREWTERLNLPKLSRYGMQAVDLERVVANCRGGSMKTNPILLKDEELTELLRRRL